MKTIKDIDSKFGSPLVIIINSIRLLHLHFIFLVSTFLRKKKINTPNIYSKQIKKNGYVVLENFLPIELLETIRESIDCSIDSGIGLNPISNDAIRDLGSPITSYIGEEDVNKGQGYLRKKTNNISINQPFLMQPKISEIAFNSSLIDVINSYVGFSTSLGGVNLRKSYKNELPALDTQCFHADKNSVKFLKVLIYLNDVGENGGPFVYVKNSHKKKFKGWLKKYRWSDKEIYNIYGEDSCIKITANTGDVIIADTTGFHKGTKPIEFDRCLLTLNYVTHKEFGAKNKIYEINKNDCCTLDESKQPVVEFLKII
jgi:ectoine hydroxylase-related dioxygenase (phytanoyl-CoA dioxygenase family)